jgi:RNA polymerase sigma factor (sigma-70 family)
VPWLHRVARNVYLSWRESETRQKRWAVEVRLTGPDERGDSTVDGLPLLSSRDPGAEHSLLLREQVDFLKVAIADLAPQQRRALLCQLHGLTTEETARLLGVAKGTVKAHVHAARRRLAEELAARFGAPRVESGRGER